VHSRKAELDAVEMLESSKIKNIILHCFNGRRHLIQRARDDGWYLSIPPIITRLQHFQMISELVPIEQLLTETDAPYLSPVPGKRNEPANVAVTIKEIAKIKNLGEKKVADEIYSNYKRIFT
jgi:TatD DNase family protein